MSMRSMVYSMEYNISFSQLDWGKEGQKPTAARYMVEIWQPCSFRFLPFHLCYWPFYYLDSYPESKAKGLSLIKGIILNSQAIKAKILFTF